MLELTRGDSWELEYEVLDQDKNPMTLTGWQIRAEVKKGTVSIKKANNLVTGGSSTEIHLNTPSKLEVDFVTNDTKDLVPGEFYDFEVEIANDSGKKITVVKELIKILPDIITWTSK